MNGFAVWENQVVSDTWSRTSKKLAGSHQKYGGQLSIKGRIAYLDAQTTSTPTAAE